MPPIKTTQILETAKYSFDPARNAWYCGKKPIEEEVLVHLIRHAKSAGIADAGAWAADALADAKTTPELTTAGFVKACMVRNRNNRIAGKYLFEKWCIEIGIRIIGKLEDFMVRNSLLVARFYNEIAAVFGTCKRQARVLGKVCNSVFFGIDFRVFIDFEIVDTPKITESSQSSKFKALRRHMELMHKIMRVIQSRLSIIN